MKREVETGNLLAGLPSAPLSAELVTSLIEWPDVCVERIVSTGQVTQEGEWYDQPGDEWVLLIAGRARLRIEGEPSDRELGPGDYVLLPAHCRHRVTFTQSAPPTVWLAIHFTPDPLRR